jgi:exopolysaccharide production protein ExoQ
VDPKGKKSFPLLFKVIEVFVLFFTLALVNINALICFRQFPEVDNYSDHEGDFISVVTIVVILIALVLLRNRLLAKYIAAWNNNKILIALLAYALVSILWTVYFPATLYKLIFLFFSTIAGAYIAIRYGLRGVIEVLTWVGAISSILSILIVMNLPLIGVMQNQPFVGSWVGIFWHRNHTGNIFAFFNMIFLLRIFLDEKWNEKQKVIFAILYLLSATIVFGSRSATGMIVFLFLHFVLGLIVLWLKFHKQLKPLHYYAAVTILATGFIVFITNTGFIFGLLGRSASMTGRVPLWQDLFQNFYLQRPLFGYGYGALWMQKSFRIEMQLRHDWPYQVYFADNGFFDILLNTGLIGLLLFMSVYIPLGVRSFKHAISTKAGIDFLPFLTFLYIFIGNLTYSFMLEVDQFVWMLLVIMVFLTTSIESNSIPQPYSHPQNTKLKNEFWNN